MSANVQELQHDLDPHQRVSLVVKYRHSSLDGVLVEERDQIDPQGQRDVNRRHAIHEHDERDHDNVRRGHALRPSLVAVAHARR